MFDLTVDHYKQKGDTGEVVLVRQTPYLRIKCAELPPMFLRDGRCYDESGEIHDPIPDVVEQEMQKSTEAALNAVGFTKEGGQIMSISRMERQGRKR